MGLYREVEVEKRGTGYIWREMAGMKRGPWKIMFYRNIFARYNRIIKQYDAPADGCFLFLDKNDLPYCNVGGMDDRDPIFLERQRMFFPLHEFDAARRVWETLFDFKTQTWKRGGISSEGYRVSLGVSSIMIKGTNGYEKLDPFYMITMPDKFIAWTFFTLRNEPYDFQGKPIEIRHCSEVDEYERQYNNEAQNGEDRAKRRRLPRPFPLLIKEPRGFGE